MIFLDINQNSKEWFELRRGKFTASTFGNLFMSPSTKGYKNSIYKVVFERLTNESPENISTPYMERGKELESEAREAYENKTFRKVTNGGFYCNKWAGASPDGHVGKDGLIEIKCPKYSTFIEYLLKKQLPKEYFYQVHFQMFCSDRKWVDFIAYHPALPLQIIRVLRDDKIITDIEIKLNNVILETKIILEKL